MNATSDTPAAGATSSDGQENPRPAADKVAAESLTLRARPRRIVRFRRGLLIGAAAVGAAGLSGLAWIALSPRAFKAAKPPDPPAVEERRGPSEQVAQLPSDYAKAGAAPRLGPALPGDLGQAVLDQQHKGGALISANDGQEGAPRPTVAQQAAEAERQRLAAQVHQAREAGVMVATTGRGAASTFATPAPDVAPEVSQQSVAGALAPSSDPGGQQGKVAFVASSAQGDVYDPHRLEAPRSPYQIMAGSVISASLLTGLDSDLPGLVTAQVSENVFDTVTGRFLLIPQGARLIGAYDSVVAFGQSRALLVWQRIILPDGSSIQLDNLPATDAAGYAGLSDQVDFHMWRLLKGVALSTLLGVGTELSLGDDESDLVRAVRQSTQQNAAQAGQQIVSKQLDVQPTVRVRPGWPLRVVVHKDLILRPWRAS